MDFRDLNDMDLLTIKSDFILDICNQANDIQKNLELFKNAGMEYDAVFKMVLKTIEALKLRLADGVIKRIFIHMNEVFNVEDENVNVYVELLNCYIKCDIENYDLKNIYTDEFAENAHLDFNMLFAPYYLNILIERYGDMDEINRMNKIVKNTIMQFKVNYGRN